MVVRLRIWMAFPRDSYRSTSMGSSVDQPVGIHSSLCASMGAAGRAARGNSSIEKITAPGEDDMPKSLDKIRRGDRVDHDEAMRGRKDSREIPVSKFTSNSRQDSFS